MPGSDKERAENFKKRHVDGEHHPSKPRNQTADFTAAEYKSLRPVGSGKGSRAEGSRPGQKMAVTKQQLPYVETGKIKHGQEGSSQFMVAGKKTGRGYQPHHLEGPVEKGPSGTYSSRNHGDLESASSSSTAPFHNSSSR